MRLGISEADAMAVGDGANDLGMIGRAGSGVALHAKPAVAREARLRVNHGDLTALPPDKRNRTRAPAFRHRARPRRRGKPCVRIRSAD